MRTHLTSLALLLAACGSSTQDFDIALMSNAPFDIFACDSDGDGILALSCGGLDCLDSDASIHAGATEVINDGIDQDCDGIDLVDCDIDGDGFIDPFCFNGDDCDPYDPDKNVLVRFYPDADGDGFRTLEGAVDACSAPEGFGTLDPEVDQLDCDDTRATDYPGATEICADGRDNSCSGELADCDILGPITACDADGDGVESIACGGDDCLDTNAAIFPDAPDVLNDGIDQNCNGRDRVICDMDEDGITDPYCAGDDCDPEDASVLGPLTWFQDADGDGFAGTPVTMESCTQPEGFSRQGPDCDDAQATVYPGGPEVCGDGLDNDCDGRRDACDPLAVVPTSFCGTEILAGGLQNFGRTLHTADLNGDGVRDLVIGATRSAQDVVVVIDGTAAGTVTAREQSTLAVLEDTGDFGMGLATGDFTGDGTTDLAVGAPARTIPGGCGPAGAISVFAGPFTGTGWTTASQVADFSASSGLTVVGSATSTTDVAGGSACRADALGWRLAGSDLDNDGTSDLVTGASRPVDATSNVAAAVFHGPFSGTELTDATATITATPSATATAGEVMGVAAVGDINGDGIRDLMVSHLQHDGANGDDLGAAWFFYGPVAPGASLDLGSADAVVRGTRAGMALGVSSGRASAADVNGDGINDVLIGEHGGDGGEGAVRLYLGPISGVLRATDADAVWTGPELGANAADGAFAGDINGDGELDLILGAQGADRFGLEGGAAYLFLGPADSSPMQSAPFIIEGAAGSSTGAWVLPMGDTTGNGLSNVAVSAPTSTGGSVFVCGAR